MSQSTAASVTTHAEPGGEPGMGTRDFLQLVALAGATIGVGAIAWPLLDYMAPSKDVLALSSVEQDLTPIAEGSGITVMWRGKPIFVRHRTAAEVKAAQDTPLSELIEPQPDSARVKADHAQWIVLIGICTHLGCIPLAHEGDYDGWFCPCHGSQYDSSGRIRRGPAPLNLAIPPYEFVSDTRIQIGEQSQTTRT